jgi:CyaY protein
MEDAIFDQLARNELRDIEDSFADVDPDDVEVSVSDGVLRLDLRDKTRIVINAHRAAKQIWMAAVSTAWHFDRGEDGRWRTGKTDEELRTSLVKIVTDRIGVKLPLVGDSPLIEPSASAPLAATTDEPSTLAVIRIWAWVAWADGKLATVEADALRKLIHSAPLTIDERRAAYAFLDHPVTSSPLPHEIPESAREGIYRAACKMAKLDGIIEPRERTMLAGLATALRLSSNAVRNVETAVFSAKKVL